jgi:hypothetical protein
MTELNVKLKKIDIHIDIEKKTSLAVHMVKH